MYVRISNSRKQGTAQHAEKLWAHTSTTGLKLRDSDCVSPTRLNVAAWLMLEQGLCFVQAGSVRMIEYATLGPELATAAILVGLTTTSILFCSHFHQIEGDIAARKVSPLVRLGTRRGYEV